MHAKTQLSQAEQLRTYVLHITKNLASNKDTTLRSTLQRCATFRPKRLALLSEP